MDGGIVLLQTAVPLLAVRLGASAILLGAMGVVAQTARLPMCFTSGRLSEKLGRTAICVPAACVFAAACALLGLAKSNAQVMALYAFTVASIGAFYPPLQAMIGDVSERGQLRKNLGMFNVGWCTGSAVMGLAARWLLGPGLQWLFFTGAAMALTAAGLVLNWRRGATKHSVAADAPDTDPGDDYGPLLLIARMGHFISFYGYATTRILFPKLAISQFHWSEATVATVVAQFLVGLGIGILVCSAAPWWRGKLWPLVFSQLAMAAAAASVYWVRSPALIGAAFFAFGVAQSITYTAALYYGLSARANRGKNTGIHEGLVAGGSISGCLLGGIVAQSIALTAPFVLLACLAGACVIATAVIRKPR